MLSTYSQYRFNFKHLFLEYVIFKVPTRKALSHILKTCLEIHHGFLVISDALLHLHNVLQNFFSTSVNASVLKG